MASYPGAYRAKALQVNNGVITAHIPQIFADIPITITDVLGGFPDGPTMGWVIFESGDPEFPIWSSGVVAANGSGGTDEVWISPDPPDDTEEAPTTIELWYDIDAVTPTENYLTEFEGQDLVHAHETKPDPHNQYLTQAEAEAIYTGIDTNIDGGRPDEHYDMLLIIDGGGP